MNRSLLSKPLSQILNELGIKQDAIRMKDQSAKALDVEVTGLSYDSRSIEKGDAFFCIHGQKTDGNKYIEDAIAKGASCIFSELPHKESPVPCIVVADVRLTLATVADYYYDHPSAKVRLIGVTGTNGKTTTTHLVEHIFAKAGNKIGLIGTLGARWNYDSGSRDYEDIKHTTPQASDLQRLLGEMAGRGISQVAMEVSSHALALKRVAHCHFAVACLTNITQDHLDFHKTMDQYWKAKRLLFDQLTSSKQTGKSAVVNLDDGLAAEFLKGHGLTVKPYTYGFADKADVHVKDVKFDFTGTHLQLVTPAGDVTLKLKLNGRFNVYNVMAAWLIAYAEGIEPAAIKSALETFTGVPGRFEVVALDQPNHANPLCIVDYAHTPDGLDNVLKAARALVPADGKLITVFGCGGDRDSSKRPQMGEIAEQKADLAYVTSDNPRSEDPDQIIADILAGIKRMKGVVVESDRAEAIKTAVREASAKDVIVVAGKGHETYQILADKTIDFDDREQVRKALTERVKATAS